MKIGVLGFGNLGSALVSGLLLSGCAVREDILICDKSPAAAALAASPLYGTAATGDCNLLIERSDVVFLTVKSYVFEELAPSIRLHDLSEKTFVSFMAGVSFEAIYSLIGDVSLVRAMPSLAIAACNGTVGYTKAPPEVAGIFHKLGYAFETPPENIEKVMAFSSCGLGFAAYLIDAFASAGMSLGFSEETSVRIASLTFQNAVDRGDFRETVRAVATPGGATERGIVSLGESGTRGIIAGAMREAYERMT